MPSARLPLTAGGPDGIPLSHGDHARGDHGRRPWPVALRAVSYTHLDVYKRQAWLVEQARVLVNPGVPFGGEPLRFARLNFATTRSLLDEGLGRIEQAVRSRRP